MNHSTKEYVNGINHTNGIESVWAVLKRGYNSIYHNFSIKHLQKYIDESTFRLNQGNGQIGTIDRINSLLHSKGKRLAYVELTQGQG